MDEVQALRGELEMLRRDNEALREQVRELAELVTGASSAGPATGVRNDASASSASSPLPVASPPPATSVARSSRRTLLRMAGAGAAGLAAGALPAGRPAAAVVGDTMRVGYNHTSFNQTRISQGATTPPNSGAFVNDGAAMLLIDATSTSGFAIEARGGFNAVRAKGTVIGVASYGEQYAFAALSSDTAAIAFGETASNGGPKLQPLVRTDQHSRAEIDNDSDGNLWWSVKEGSPGQWRKLAGPGTAGAFHPITPTRVYDSRVPFPGGGKIAGGEHRTIRIADARDLATGTVVANDVVPPGATAITGNLTIDATEIGGYLALNEGGNLVVSSSAINWFATGQTIGNGFVVRLDVDRNVTVVAGNGRCHLLIDVTGYYL